MIKNQNIYYMLAYAYQVLNERGYKNIATESFENTADLCSAILVKGLSAQIKRGLGKEYIPKTEAISSLRGKIDISDSIKSQTLMRRQMICTYDEFSINSYMNKIIKSTILLLIKADISSKRKKELRKLLVYMGEVDVLDIHCINWNQQYNRNNQTYRMLISICYLIIKGLLQTKSDGSTKLMDFFDEQRMCRLYEKFILEYYKKEHPQIEASASQIPWQLDDGFNEMLPVMQTDIMLSYAGKTLIIDAKYYEHSLQQKYDNYSIHSSNLYQIFTYVKNKEVELSGQERESVAGMLLYAKTDEVIYPNHEYKMSGNRIAVQTLDLDKDFEKIKMQLDGIVEKYLYSGNE